MFQASFGCKLCAFADARSHKLVAHSAAFSQALSAELQEMMFSLRGPNCGKALRILNASPHTLAGKHA